MIKKKKLDDQFDYHPDPRNNVEQFIYKRLPAILKAYGLGDIKFNFITPSSDKMKWAPEDGIFCIKYDPIYKAAYITIAQNAVDLYKVGEYKTLSDAVIHEVGHIVTHKLESHAKNRHTTKKDIDDTVEETTETIARIAANLLAKVDPVTFKL